MRKVLIEFVPGLVGGLVGGILGYYAVSYGIGHGLWIPILPGAFAGLACGQLSPVASRARGILNGLIALGVAIYAQWQLFIPPFQFDGSLPGYLAQIHKLPVLTLIILVVNGLLGYWWGRERSIRSYSKKPPAVAQDWSENRS